MKVPAAHDVSVNIALLPLQMQVFVIRHEERRLVGVLCSILSFGKRQVLQIATKGKSKYIVETTLNTEMYSFPRIFKSFRIYIQHKSSPVAPMYIVQSEFKPYKTPYLHHNTIPKTPSTSSTNISTHSPCTLPPPLLKIILHPTVVTGTPTP